MTDAGAPDGITVVSTDMNEDQLGLSRRSLQKAIYSPRFAEGKPVSTSGVTFTGEWYEELNPKEPAPTPPPKNPPPVEPPRSIVLESMASRFEKTAAELRADNDDA